MNFGILTSDSKSVIQLHCQIQFCKEIEVKEMSFYFIFKTCAMCVCLYLLRRVKTRVFFKSNFLYLLYRIYIEDSATGTLEGCAIVSYDCNALLLALQSIGELRKLVKAVTLAPAISEKSGNDVYFPGESDRNKNEAEMNWRRSLKRKLDQACVFRTENK